MSKIRDAFRMVSWWGFLSFLLVAVAVIAFVFFAESFKLAVFCLVLAVWAMLASFRDE